MKKYLITAIIVFVTTLLHSQDNNNYTYKPFPIYKSPSQVIIAGDLNTFVYSNYYGKDVQKQGYTDPHSKPEYLVYELFRDMKIKDVEGINKLYDTSFKKDYFDDNSMISVLKGYTDIKFISKFKSGYQVIIRYNFVSTQKEYPYFAAITGTEGNYYLTLNINISAPVNIIGSYSPFNLFDKPAETVNTATMTPFYFVNKENKIFYTNELPGEDYSAVYVAFDFPNEKNAPANMSFIQQLQNTAQAEDSAKMESLIDKTDLPLLAKSVFSDYVYKEIRKIFRNYPLISPMASIKTNEGRVLYFKYADEGESANIGCIIIRELQGRQYLSLKINNDDINNVLQNAYIREAIYDYFKHKL
ncbi:MAG: hypothetical protein ACHQF0_03560 [Chitinophagales bacterium]